jgi:hypothetical protein
MDVETANERVKALQHAAGGDPYGVRTIAGARALYLRDEIDIQEFERRVELFLSGKPIAVLWPGEQVLGLGNATAR